MSRHRWNRFSQNRVVKVVQFDPRLRWLLSILAVVTVFLTAILAYNAGMKISGDELVQLRVMKAEYQNKLDRVEVESRALKQRLSVLERTSKLDREAVNNVQSVIKVLEEEKASLVKDLSFYKSIVAPDDKRFGVRLHSFRLIQGEDDNQYLFRLVVSQFARDNPLVKGVLNVWVRGVSEGKKQTLSLLELAGFERSEMLAFRYFQAFPANRGFISLNLPEDFKAETVVVEINIQGKSSASKIQELDWGDLLHQPSVDALVES